MPFLFYSYIHLALQNKQSFLTISKLSSAYSYLPVYSATILSVNKSNTNVEVKDIVCDTSSSTKLLSLRLFILRLYIFLYSSAYIIFLIGSQTLVVKLYSLRSYFPKVSFTMRYTAQQYYLLSQLGIIFYSSIVTVIFNSIYIFRISIWTN